MTAPALGTLPGSTGRKQKKPQQPGLQTSGPTASASQGLQTSGTTAASTTGTPATRNFTPADRNPQAQPQTQQQLTFAQQQEAGQARPAPPTTRSTDQTGFLPQTGTIGTAGATGGTNTTTGTSGGQTLQSGTGPVSQTDPTIQSQLQQSISKQLQTPSRYDTATFNAIKDPAVADLQHQYDLQGETLNADLARRGLAASTFGENDIHDLGAAQARDMASLNANLLQGAANTQAADTTAAQTGAQNYQNSLLAQQLGLGNLGIQQGNLTGTYNGAPTAQASQFGQQLAQTGNIATMQNQTQNRQVDAEAALAQNQLLVQVAQLLGLGGYLPGQQNAGNNPTTGGTPPSGGGGTGTGGTSGGGGPSTGTGGTGGTGGGTGSPGGTGGTPIDNGPGGGGGPITLDPNSPSNAFIPGNRSPSTSTSLIDQIRQRLGLAPTSTYGQVSTGSTGMVNSQSPNTSTSSTGTPGYVTTANQPSGQTAGQTFKQNTTPNATTGAGPLSLGATSGGTDPMSLYAQGKINYTQLQQMMAQINPATGAGNLNQSSTTQAYTPAQLSNAVGTQFQNFINAQTRNMPYASQAYIDQNKGAWAKVFAQSLDPTALAQFKTLYPGLV